MPLHSSASGTELHESKRQKQPVRAASIANVTIGTPGTTMDGVTLGTGDRVLLKDQSTLSDNGPYVWTGAATPLARASDGALSSDFVALFIIGVQEGTVNAGTHWVFTSDTTGFAIEVDDIEFTNMTNPVFGSAVTAPSLTATGLTGAINSSRYAGAVNGAAPASGSFLVGDYVVDRTYGGMWICTVAGSPGTWRSLGAPPDVAAARLYLATNYS
jgi:hypothetical protein